MNIKSKIGNLIEIDWQNDLYDLQPEDVKVLHNQEHLKQSLLKHGFALPFFAWKDKDQYFCIDGHTRKGVLKQLIGEGVGVPTKLTAVEIIAENRKEAIEILLEVFNQKSNPFSDENLFEWIDDEKMVLDDINLASIPIEIFDMKGSEFDFAKKNKEIDIDSFDDEMTIKFTFPESTYNIVKSKLGEAGNSPEDALLKILKIG